MRRTLTVIAALLALAVAGCGGESLSESLTERAIEQAGGGNVDVEFDDDGENFEVNVETDEGSITIGGGDIPDGLEVPVPDGGEVTTSMTLDNDISVSVRWPASEYERLVSFYDDWADQQPADFERTSSTFDSDDGTFRNTGWYSSEADITINVGDCFGIQSGELDGACVTITQSG